MSNNKFHVGEKLRCPKLYKARINIKLTRACSILFTLPHDNTVHTNHSA